MHNFITRFGAWLAGERRPVVMDRGYVSDFTRFIDRYLAEHPDVPEDQRLGRLIYWDKQVDLAALEKLEQESVPDDAYGFGYSAWRPVRKP